PDSAYSFDGADDYIEVLDDDTLDLSGGLTISAWINSSDTSGARDIVAKWGAGLKRSYIFKDHNWSDNSRHHCFHNTYRGDTQFPQEASYRARRDDRRTG
ncbi:unnamed protein product, partial [marine sediment metagenome]